MVVFIIVVLSVLALILFCLWRSTVIKLACARRLISVARNRNYERWMENKELSSKLERKQEELDALQRNVNNYAEANGSSIH